MKIAKSICRQYSEGVLLVTEGRAKPHPVDHRDGAERKLDIPKIRTSSIFERQVS
jgi:hypothetical protein